VYWVKRDFLYTLNAPIGYCAYPGLYAKLARDNCCWQTSLRFTPHDFRSFYVTKRRSDGATDTVIAGEIGDKMVALMQTTHGERPKNWLGGAAVLYVPKDSAPTWEVWKKENRQEIDFLLTTAKAHKLKTPLETRLPVWRNGRRTGLKILS
jgi:hypothetical protein